MSPSKWIFTIGGIIEVLLLCLLVDVLASKKQQEDVLQPVETTRPIAESVQDAEQQSSWEAVEGSLYGLPITLNGDQGQIISRKGYTLSYNKWRLIPDWVAYELTYQETLGEVPRDKGFYPDPEVRDNQANVDDYRHSGWDRGHMAPAGDMKWSEEAMKESCYFTNICPQNPDLNGGKWRILEEKCRDLAAEYSQIQIVCGPIIENAKLGSIGSNHVLIPDAFFKVLLVRQKDQYEGIGFYFKNEPASQSLRNYSCTIDEIEQKAGIDFFSRLTDDIENSVESRYSFSFWDI